MEQTISGEFSEFCDLMAAIRTEAALLGKMILSQEEEKEELEILSKFDSSIQAQVFSTLTNLCLYQVRGWRGLING